MKGTVWPRPFIKDPETGARRPVKGSTWTFQFAVPKAGGGRRQISKGGFRTKKDAEEALAAALADHGRAPNSIVEPSKMPLSRYLTEEWLPTTAVLKPSTAESYRLHVERYIVPKLGHVRLCDLTAAQVTKFYAFLLERGGTSRKKGAEPYTQPLSERTIHKTHVVLGSALTHAVEVGMLRVNPVSQVPRKSRPKQGGGNDKPEMKVWTSEEAMAFLDAAAGDRYIPLYDLGLSTGLRRGELAGLRWADVDLDANSISVRRNRIVVGNQVHDLTPKSNRARVVDLDPGTVTVLRRWRRGQLEERMAWGEAWTDSGYVFTREDGTALHPDTISWHLQRLIAQINKAIVKAHWMKPGKPTLLPTIRLHDLRHTHATLGLAAGVPAKVMQERLGHSSIQITLDLYSHVVPGMQADAAAKIGGLLRRAQ